MYSKDDVFLVTGGSSGIGAACSLKLNSQGARVICLGRDTNKLDKLKEYAENQSEFITDSFDFGDDLSGFQKLVKNLVSKHGKIRGCVISSGMQNIEPLSMITEKSASELIRINYLASLFVAKTFCDKRIHRSGNSSLVFISSISSIKGYPGISNYSASKGALNSLSRSLASEMSREKVRVNSVLFGLVKTEMIEKNKKVYSDEYLKELDNNYPLGIGSVEDAIGPILFLLSNESRWITGSELIVDGGASLL